MFSSRRHVFTPTSRRGAGFTLIELAVTLLISGLLAGLFLGVQQYAGVNDEKCRLETTRELQVIQDALDRFAVNNTRMLRPANRDVNQSSTSYGEEAGLTSLPAYPAVGVSEIVFGAVPFRSLGLSEDFATDCWSNKYTYAVTSTLTDPSNYANKDNSGKIVIRNAPDPLSQISDAGVYIVISHGEDELGASAQSSDKPSWCAEGVTTKNANCNITDKVFIDGVYATGNATNYFDDQVVYRTHKKAVDGGWSSFGGYGDCIGGLQSRKRICNNPTPANGGFDCGSPYSPPTGQGSDTETRPCNKVCENSQDVCESDVTAFTNDCVATGGEVDVVSDRGLTQRCGYTTDFSLRCCR